MRWSINQITLAGGSRRPPANLPADLEALRAGGWRAVEVWLPHWDSYLELHGLPAGRRLLDDTGLRADGGCGVSGTPLNGGLFFSRGAERRAAHDALERRLEQCQALGAPHLVIAPGFGVPEDPVEADLGTAAASLGVAAEAAARYGVRLGIEFLAAARLVNTLPTALALAERAAHPNLGVVLDTYHFYAGRSKTEDLDLLRADPRRLFFIHVSDVDAAKPRDLWAVPDRVLPGAGGIPNLALIERCRALGFDGGVSLELFDAGFEVRWRDDPRAAATLAYERCTALLPDHEETPEQGRPSSSSPPPQSRGA